MPNILGFCYGYNSVLDSYFCNTQVSLGYVLLTVSSFHWLHNESSVFLTLHVWSAEPSTHDLTLGLSLTETPPCNILP